MATKDWLAPLVVGALGFGAMLLVPAKHVAEHDALPDIRPAFTSIAAVQTADGNSTTGSLLATWAQPVEVVGGSWLINHLRLRSNDDASMRPIIQRTPWLVSLPVGLRPGWTSAEALVDGEHVADVHLASGPRLGLDGYNATRVTVHVFDADGELVASNGNASEQARLTRTYSAEQLPTGTWYLGAQATAPAGTQKPPLVAQAFLGQARPLLTGLPVGGIATAETDALAGLYGHVWVTLQVDALVHAP